MTNEELQDLQRRSNEADLRLSELRGQLGAEFLALAPEDQIGSALELARAQALSNDLKRQCMAES